MTGPAALLRNVEVRGRRVDVLTDGERVCAIEPHHRGIGPDRIGAVEVVEGRGGALIPGLHDHHLHLLSLAASRQSVDLGGLRGLPAVGAALRAHARAELDPSGWVRAVGYHESVAGRLDRHVLDVLMPDRPVRVQHRSGALWILNSAALGRLSFALDDSGDVERDGRGAPTGRLWRYDERLRERLPHTPPDLRWVGERLRELGITGVTDATPDLDAGAVRLLGEQVASGHLPGITVLGAPIGSALPAGILPGPHKIMMRDHDLSLDHLSRRVAEARAAGRSVAIHCVTMEALVLVLATLREGGSLPGDRIEHGAVIPAELHGDLRRLGLRVVTQPDFIRIRGDAYRREVDRQDLGALYPYRSLVADGIPTAPSSDAPFGVLDPWQVMRSAAERRTSAGDCLGMAERVSARTVLAGYHSPPDDPGGRPRRLQPGVPADLVLLRGALRDVLADPGAGWIRRTFVSDAGPRGTCMRSLEPPADPAGNRWRR